MNYRESTEYILADLERKPGHIAELENPSQERFTAIRGLVMVIAPNFIDTDEIIPAGQIARGLSTWHQDLRNQCSALYSSLTSDPEGPLLSRKEANVTPGLQDLHAVRMGVRAAMNNYYRYAHSKSSAPILKNTQRSYKARSD
jgi:hypothetical protein